MLAIGVVDGNLAFINTVLVYSRTCFLKILPLLVLSIVINESSNINVNSNHVKYNRNFKRETVENNNCLFQYRTGCQTSF